MKKYRLNPDALIGDTLFIVEGAKTEFDIIESIFTKRLGFQIVKKVRGNDGYILKGSNPSKQVFAFNFEKNQLHKQDFNELNKLYSELRNVYGFNPDKAAVYLIYDRDVQCYEPYGIDVRNDYIMRFTNCLSSGDKTSTSGYDALLILSYPSIESYLTSCFLNDTYTVEHSLGNQLKIWNTNNKLEWRNVFKKKYDLHKKCHIIDTDEMDKALLHAVEEMNKAILHFGVSNYNIDDFYSTNIKVFDAEEAHYSKSGNFKLLSLLSVILMQLGIIHEVSDFDPSEPRAKK